MSAADCERWENRLLDLAYGEIEEADEREVRAHLDGCEHCRSSLGRLSRGRALASKLPQLEAPPDVMQVVLRAARDKALELEASRKAAAVAQAKQEVELAEAARPAPAAPQRSWWESVLAVVMAPQFAMATILLLTVGVGLWWFPGSHGDGRNAPRLVSEPTAAAGPEALVPAEPLRFDVDPRTGRVEAHHEGEAETVAEARPPSRIRPPPVVVSPDEAGTETAVATVHVEDGESAGMVVDGVLPDTARSTGPEMGIAMDEPALPSAGDRITEAPMVPSSEAAAERAPGGVAPPPAAPSTAGATGLSYDVERADPDGDVMLSAGLLRQARELARAGRDRDAIAQYESFLRGYRTAGAAPTAMLELADCYRRTGQLDRARSWLERAAAIPSVATAARRELVRLDAAELAASREATSGE